MSAPMVDLAAAFDRHGLDATTTWLGEHLEAITLQIGTGAAARDASSEEPEMLERLVMHLVADTLTAPVLHARWKATDDMLALEGYGATQGVIRVTAELLTDYADRAVLEHVQRRLDVLVGQLTTEGSLPEHPPLL